VGIIGVLLTMPMMRFIIFCGGSLRDMSHATYLEFTTLPTTPVLIAAGWVLSRFWYVVPGLMLAAYLYWVVKTAKRVLWFNAIMAILFPLLLWGTMAVTLEQQRLFQEAMRQHSRDREQNMSPSSKRPAFQLHLASAILMSVAAGLVMLANSFWYERESWPPGMHVGLLEPGYTSIGKGWPYTHTTEFWQKSSPAERMQQSFGECFYWDFAIGVGIVIGAAVACEYLIYRAAHQRKRRPSDD
jgi:hypothetical protein